MNQEDRGLPHRSGPIEVLGSASVSSGAGCTPFHELSYSNNPHPSRSSPAPTPSTQRTACDADRVGRLVDAAVRRCGGAELARGLTVRQTLSCVRLAIIVVASAITPKTRGAALFRNIRTRRTPLCTLIFEIGFL